MPEAHKGTEKFVVLNPMSGIAVNPSQDDYFPFLCSVEVLVVWIYAGP